MRIEEFPLPAGEFYAEVTKKDTIYLHHTAGGHRADNVIKYWGTDNRGHVATAYVVGGISTDKPDTTYDGRVFRAFDDKYWAHHLGLKAKNNTLLNKKSVGIEVCNWGPLKPDGDHFLNYVARSVPKEAAYKLATPWQGYQYYHKYTDKQLLSLRALILDIANRHSINVKKEWDFSSFKINADALAGKPGLWTHVNVRKDKYDMSPMPELIDMLNTL